MKSRLEFLMIPRTIQDFQVSETISSEHIMHSKRIKKSSDIIIDAFVNFCSKLCQSS